MFNSFHLFCIDHRAFLEASNPMYSDKEVDYLLEEKWNELDNRTKEQYRTKAIRIKRVSTYES